MVNFLLIQPLTRMLALILSAAIIPFNFPPSALACVVPFLMV